MVVLALLISRLMILTVESPLRLDSSEGEIFSYIGSRGFIGREMAVAAAANTAPGDERRCGVVVRLRNPPQQALGAIGTVGAHRASIPPCSG